jgi:hypothetical protein
VAGDIHPLLTEPGLVVGIHLVGEVTERRLIVHTAVVDVEDLRRVVEALRHQDSPSAVKLVEPSE